MAELHPIIRTDVLVVGAGPAGLAAAIEAARLGVRTLLIDDKKSPGGQLVKQTHMFFGSKNERAGVRGIDIAVELGRELEAVGCSFMAETMAIGVFDDGTVTALHRDSQIVRIIPRTMVVATGAFENMLLFPGCDLPGVYGAGGFQTLMNLDGVLPGTNVLMVGAGNIGLIVAYQLMQAGGRVAAVVEAMPRTGGYSVHASKIRRMGVPLHLAHTVKAVHGADRVNAATIVRLEQGKEVPGSAFTLAVDSVCLSVGLSPLAELCSMAGCRMDFVPALGGYVPYHDENMMTSNDRIFIAGDVSGIEEASIAMVEGTIAGCSAAARILGWNVEQRLGEHKRQLETLRGGPYGKKARQGKSELWGIELEDEPALEYAPASDLPQAVQRFTSGKRLVIECYDRIPCNPCEEACRQGAIRIGPDITSVPELDADKCTACGVCMMRCPGLAIFMVNMDYAADMAEVTIPFEQCPLPQKGETWTALDRQGAVLGPALVTRVVSATAFDRKHLVSFSVPKQQAHDARHIVPAPPSPRLIEATPQLLDTDPIICRCEDVRLSAIEKVIDQGYRSYDEIRRITRAGMGPCQGKTCQRLILQILSRKLGVPMDSLQPSTVRPPLKPVPFDVLAAASMEDANEY